MTLPALILRELRHHRLNAILSATGLVVAVGLLTLGRAATAAAERETRRVLRDLGFNLRIIPRETDMGHFWAKGYSDQTLPADSVDRLASQAGLFVSFNHLTPALERHLPIDGQDVLLTGLGRPVVGPGEKKAPLGLVIAPGHAVLGHAVASRLQVKRGATLTVGPRTLTIDRLLVEAGTDEDVRLYTALEDAQAILGLPGRISEIKAIDCLCLTSDQDPLGQLRAVLEKALPGGRVLQLRSIADARARQRQMMTRLDELAGPVVVGAAGVWIAVLAGLNVRERRSELGLWRALGHGSARLAGLFLGRAALLGAVGALAGWTLGTAVALAAGPRLFPVTAGSLAADSPLLAWAMLLTPAFAALASFLPTALAVAHDPAETLRAD